MHRPRTKYLDVQKADMKYRKQRRLLDLLGKILKEIRRMEIDEKTGRTNGMKYKKCKFDELNAEKGRDQTLLAQIENIKRQDLLVWQISIHYVSILL